MDRIDVLDHGYIRLVDHMGSDLSVANAARVSFAKESGFDHVCPSCLDIKPHIDGVDFEICENCWVPMEFVLKLGDKKLIQFLAKNGHTSPFRHAFVTLEVKAPLLVARQWWKYVVGSDHTMDGWNEVSRRYVQDGMEFYIPDSDKWRSAPESKKQGSGEPIDAGLGSGLVNTLRYQIERDLFNYEQAISMGVAIEQARLFLPAYGMYTMWRWSASLQSVGHFLKQRLGDDAQWEIAQFAEATYELTKNLYPESISALVGRS